MNALNKELTHMTLANQQRLDTIKQIEQVERWDMVIIGGGITGAGVAREAARQGLRVLLLEQKDFSWGTSSRSSKMVHGGLRYLAMGNLKLTSHSVKERERLMNEAPGLVDLLTYSWPHYEGSFPGPKVFNGLLALYDLFAGKRYRFFTKKEDVQYDLPNIRQDGLMGATRFADAVTDDSRLVMRVLSEATHDGALTINYFAASELIKEGDQVVGVLANDQLTEQSYAIKAKVVVSATGAWADKFRGDLGFAAKIRPLRGSHLLLPSWRLPVSQSITLKHPTDNRSMFIYPWEGMTVIGTTDLDNPTVNLNETSIQAFEVDYLLAAANAMFPAANIVADDIVASFAGVRPIVSGGALSPSSEKRDHSIWNDKGLISVSGGKLTTFRLIALDVLKAAALYIPSLDWRDHLQNIFSKTTQVPDQLKQLNTHWQRRLLGFYGQDVQALCDGSNADEWVLVPGTQTFWAQLRFACQAEQVINLDDLLLRRTRLGLCLKNGGIAYEQAIKKICMAELAWDETRWLEQWQRYQRIWQDNYSVPR